MYWKSAGGPGWVGWGVANGYDLIKSRPSTNSFFLGLIILLDCLLSLHFTSRIWITDIQIGYFVIQIWGFNTENAYARELTGGAFSIRRAVLFGGACQPALCLSRMKLFTTAILFLNHLKSEQEKGLVFKCIPNLNVPCLDCYCIQIEIIYSLTFLTTPIFWKFSLERDILQKI